MRTLIGYTIALVLMSLLILAAVPGFEEARLRERLARVNSDLSSIAVALDAYYADNGIYPYDGYSYDGSSLPYAVNYWLLPYMMTTPVAYLDRLPMVDPFRVDVLPPDSDLTFAQYRYTSIRSTWGSEYDSWEISAGVSVYYSTLLDHYGEYRILSVGPDGTYGPSDGSWQPVSYPAFPVPYDPTNGLFSDGDIERSQRIPTHLR